MDARTKFIEVLPNKNVFSPSILEYGEAGDFVYELSVGNFMGIVIFGVTVVNTITKEHDTERSQPFDTLNDAGEYIKGLK